MLYAILASGTDLLVSFLIVIAVVCLSVVIAKSHWDSTDD